MARIKLLRNRMRRKIFHLEEKILYTKDILGNQYQIGDHTYGKPKVISWGEGTSLRIGKYCSIAKNVVIFLGSEHRIDWVSTYPFPFLWKEANSIPGHPATKGDVFIGNDVWVGFGSVILSGVTIGDGSAIGAGSVVVRDVPPYAIVAGNPAQIIRYRFDKEVIIKLLEIKWWNWPDHKVKENVHLICSQAIDEFIKRFE